MYTLARLGLFVASYVVILGVWVLLFGDGAVPWLWPLLLAAVVSGVASYFLLQGPRSRFAARVDQRATTMTRRLEKSRGKEDKD